jgi:hypothetical protein
LVFDGKMAEAPQIIIRGVINTDKVFGTHKVQNAVKQRVAAGAPSGQLWV